MQKLWFRTALLNLFIAAFLGALMRYSSIEEISWMNFGNIMHTHSHVAMLGWVYLSLYTFLVYAFLSDEKRNAPFYNTLFWWTQASVVGMLIAFPIQGYAAWSIAFSTLHIILSYIFVFRFWKDLGKQKKKVIYSRLFVKTALSFMLLSTLALWGMGPIMAMGLKGSPIYHGAIQFYLHFQFNGWFIFALLALFFKMLEDAKIKLPRQTTTFYILLSISCLVTYLITVIWSHPVSILFFINGAGIIVQLVGLVFFLMIIKSLWQPIKKLSSRWVNSLFMVAFLSFILKIIIQTAVIIPYLAKIGYSIRNYVIGFLHLLLLGLVTSFLFGMGTKLKFISTQNSWAKIGTISFLIGLALTEFILFLQGTMFWQDMGFLPQYYEILFFSSLFLPLGIALILISQKKENGFSKSSG